MVFSSLLSLQSHLLLGACLPSRPLCTALSLKTNRRASLPGEQMRRAQLGHLQGPAGKQGPVQGRIEGRSTWKHPTQCLWITRHLKTLFSSHPHCSLFRGQVSSEPQALGSVLGSLVEGQAPLSARRIRRSSGSSTCICFTGRVLSNTGTDGRPSAKGTLSPQPATTHVS